MSAVTTPPTSTTTTTTSTDIPALQCYASPYGLFGILLHLRPYYHCFCILIYQTPFLMFTHTLSELYHRHPRYTHHKVNVFFCLIFNISGPLLIGMAWVSCPTSELLAYFGVSAVLPLTTGILMTGSCLRMDTERQARSVEKTTRGDIEAFSVLVYLVACGFELNDVVALAKGHGTRILG